MLYGIPDCISYTMRKNVYKSRSGKHSHVKLKFLNIAVLLKIAVIDLHNGRGGTKLPLALLGLNHTVTNPDLATTFKVIRTFVKLSDYAPDKI